MLQAIALFITSIFRTGISFAKSAENIGNIAEIATSTGVIMTNTWQVSMLNEQEAAVEDAKEAATIRAMRRKHAINKEREALEHEIAQDKLMSNANKASSVTAKVK